MAIARPRLVTQISGTLGPVEFAQHKSLAILRKRKKPQTLITWRTIEAQRLQAQRIAAWQWLKTQSYDPIGRWHTWAINHPVKNRLGQTHTLSAFQWFCKLYCPTRYLQNFSIYAPRSETPASQPINVELSIFGDQMISINAEFPCHDYQTTIKIIYYSDPILPTTNLTRLRHHLLTYQYAYAGQHIFTDYTDLCIQRNIWWPHSGEYMFTIIGLHAQELRSQPFTFLTNHCQYP